MTKKLRVCYVCLEPIPLKLKLKIPPKFCPKCYDEWGKDPATGKPWKSNERSDWLRALMNHEEAQQQQHIYRRRQGFVGEVLHCDLGKDDDERERAFEDAAQRARKLNG